MSAPPSADRPWPGPAGAPGAEAVPDFTGIPGLSMTQTLLYLPGHEAIYAKVLAQFVQHYQSGLGDLPGWLRTGQWTQAHRQLHSLRGACAAVGADDIAARALPLEDHLLALARGEVESASATLLDDAGTLAQALASLVAALGRRQAEAAARSTHVGDSARADQ